MFEEGKIECVERLLKPAKKVLKLGKEINYDPFEKRIGLWNEIRENYENYLDGSCGSFLPDLDHHFRSQFEVSLLVLASSFRCNKEDFKAAERFSDREIEVYEKINRYNVFEIINVDDIKKKIVSKDKELLRLFEDYYVYMDRWVEEVLGDPSFKLPLRYYLKNKWEGYKKKINEAIRSLITELDWFGNLISEWKREVREKEEKIRKIFEELRGKERVEKGSRFVEVEEAKQYELNFIGRIERKLDKEIEIFGKKFKVEDVKEYREVESVKFGVLGDKDTKNLPENRYIEVKLVEKKLLGSKRRYTLKAVFASRIDKYAEYGFDTDPLELKDVNIYMTEARDKAKLEGYTVVLCLASPTGFEDAVKEHVSGDEFHKNFLSKYLSICLLDLETGKLIYNPHDEVAKEFAKICEIEIDAEKKSRVKRCVEGMIEKDWVTFKDALACGNEAIVKAVFYELAEEKGWKVKYVEGVGLVLMK